jgi:hypothetical protein
MHNLSFIGQRRAAGEIARFKLAFVVQTANYREVPDFVKLAGRFNVDQVQFSLIHHWGRAMSQEAFAAAQIWRADHPMHADFLRVFRDPIFDDRRVSLGDLSPFRALPTYRQRVSALLQYISREAARSAQGIVRRALTYLGASDRPRIKP